MDRNIKVELTNLCLIQKEDKILMQKRMWEGNMGYTFPGGHIESGETVTNSVIREMKEETGLDIKSIKLCGVKDWNNDDGSRYLVLIFKAIEYTGSIKSSDEGDVEWISINDFSKYNIIWNMDMIYELINDDSINEIYYTDGVPKLL